MNKFVRALDHYFRITSSGSNVSTEIRAGITTFLTMAYILAVNPAILSNAIQIPGHDLTPELFTSTTIVIIVGTLLMGLFAKFPFAVAPGMGINAFFTYSLVLEKNVSWQTALGAVVIAGVLFIIITLMGVREKIIGAIPISLKKATGVGIGLFLAYLGLINSGLIVSDSVLLIRHGNLHDIKPLLAIVGLLATTVMLALRVRGAILIGILISSVLAILTKAPVFHEHAFAGFQDGIVALPIWPSTLLNAFDFKNALDIGISGAIFSFLFVTFFDTAGTLIGLAEKAGFTDGQGHIPRASQAFLVDAIATTTSGVMGTSPAVCYIESAAGVEEGGRTGLTAVVIAVCFFFSLFFWPLIDMVPHTATAPALIIVGAMMMSSVTGIDWSNYRTSIPSFLTIIMIPLTHSITHGIAYGIISYTAIHIASLQFKRLHWIMWLLSATLTGLLLLD